MSKWKNLSISKKIGVIVAGLFILGTVSNASQKSQTEVPNSNSNVGQTNTVDVSKQQPIDTIETKDESRTEIITFESMTQNDATLTAGSTKVAVAGVNGERTITYKVTFKNGKETTREEVSNQVTKPPISEIIKLGTKKATTTSSNCDSNYSGCVPIASDVDCAGGSGNGPAYVAGPVSIIGNDIYGLDGDDDGVGCE